MARTKTVSIPDLKREYARLQELAPNIQTLHRDEFTHDWFLGNYRIGTTAREARAYIEGVYDGIRFAGFIGA